MESSKLKEIIEARMKDIDFNHGHLHECCKKSVLNELLDIKNYLEMSDKIEVVEKEPVAV